MIVTVNVYRLKDLCGVCMPGAAISFSFPEKGNEATIQQSNRHFRSLQPFTWIGTNGKWTAAPQWQ